MSSPTVLLNNLVTTEEETTYIDPLSKAYLIGDVVLGSNRLVLFGRLKPLIIFLGFAYSFFFCAVVFYTTFFIDSESFFVVVLGVESMHYIVSTVFNVLVWKRLKRYYQELQEFDLTIGCRPKRTAASVRNFVQMCISVTVLTLVIPYDWFMYDGLDIFQQAVYLPVHLIQIIEIHFYGHLLSLVVPRLRLINYYMRISLSDRKSVAAPKVDELTFKSTLESQNCQMKKIMDLYCLMISAYDVLIDAIKWQFVMVLTSMFISLLSYSYISALTVIRGTRPFLNVAIEFSFATVRTLTLFAPCVFGDQIQEEVRLLREHVASRLYEDKLNKAGRSVARALLALTEARDLSFSLLQVFDIDISLPFKFMGLLLTYLIILLQFEKEMKRASVVVIVDGAVPSAPVSMTVTMSSPTVLLNNLVQEEVTTHIDPISKAYLIAEMTFGINRLVVFDKIRPLLIFLASTYSLYLCAVVFYTAFFYDVESLYNVVVGIDSAHYILSIVLSSILWKRLQNYYKKLQEFDVTVGCRPKKTAGSVKTLIQVCVTIFLMMITLPYELFTHDTTSTLLHVVSLPFRFLLVIDIYFYGHLLSLLVPRLRLINYYMKISLEDRKKVVAPKVEELKLKSVILETQNCEMKKLMELYCLIIGAYDVLIDAIKWQFLMGLTSMFISILSFSYIASLTVIRGSRLFFDVAKEATYTAIRLLPMFAPCIFADQIQEEVQRLRELLASRLYENKLNKAGRSVARALLALTEARDLSFSLLQVFDIDISLPFKFMGLLLTYLIILLQFEKVINP